jgi:hypothetical protein
LSGGFFLGPSRAHISQPGIVRVTAVWFPLLGAKPVSGVRRDDVGMQFDAAKTLDSIYPTG